MPMGEKCLEIFRSCFASMAVYKDLKKNNFFTALGLPSFMRDWLLQRYQNEDGVLSKEDVVQFVKEYIPRRDDWGEIENRIVFKYERVKILAKIIVEIDIKTGGISFSLPDFPLAKKQTLIEPETWEEYGQEISPGKETWGLLELDYRQPDDTARPKIPGKVRLCSFKDFCPYQIDLEYYQEVRKQFTTEEWIDILLGAIDYNADGYQIARQNDPKLPEVNSVKLMMLTRLLPFLEKRLNLMELAPKGTGKSYVFGQVSRFGWLSTSDKMTRAKLFYDMGSHESGLVTQNDFIVLDEIQKTIFDDGMGSTMQGYLEQGTFTVGKSSNTADAGMIICGNIAQELMDQDGVAYMLGNLPKMFQEPALIDRFHGFIKGWYIPRMNDDLKIAGWALNSEYFTSILHELRSDGLYRSVVDEMVDVPSGADTRDTEAIKRIATAYLKLLFPNVRDPNDISNTEFNQYCLRRAADMRTIIRNQLKHIDIQYSKPIPDLKVKKFAPST